MKKACATLQAEIIVVDNRSTDGSVAYLSSRFPEVLFIRNERNTGFAKACNQGLCRAQGRYILFLNPDTLLAEDTLQRCLHFFETHADAGAIGVKMVDGTGTFLKESKRSFPSPFTSLYKLFGLARLFPHSAIFSRYYLGHLDENKNQEVDVLAGAFMLIRKEVLEKTGGFDEDFFMYGEDIDLSYRIQQAGYKNFYLAEAPIIHFKGESTKRGSLNYVRLFYQAMRIFVHKHYGGARAGLFNAFIHLAIWIRAAMSAGAKLIKWAGLPVIDAVLILLSFWLVKEFWTAFIKTEIVYSNRLLLIAFPLYTLVYLAVAYYAGLYNNRYRRTGLVRSMLVATLVLLAGYAMLPERFRFSRGIILFGSLLAFGLIHLLRWMLVQGKILQKPADRIAQPYLLIASTQTEFAAVKNLLQKKGLHTKVIGRLAVDSDEEQAITYWKEVATVAPALYAKEVIICAGALSYRQIILGVQQLRASSLRIRFHAAGSKSMVGSDSSAAGGESLSAEDELNLAKPTCLRLKRLIDVAAACLLLLGFPLFFFLIKPPFRLFKNCISVLLGKKTWVGYSVPQPQLPHLRTPVIAVDKNIVQHASLHSQQMVDYWYARNYEPVQDIKLLIKNYHYLSR